MTLERLGLTVSVFASYSFVSKPSAPLIISNYRPISIVHIMVKIVKRVVQLNLITVLMYCSLHPPSQVAPDEVPMHVNCTSCCLLRHLYRQIDQQQFNR